MSNLTHQDAEGRVRMVDVGDKTVTRRTATASPPTRARPSKPTKPSLDLDLDNPAPSRRADFLESRRGDRNYHSRLLPTHFSRLFSRAGATPVPESSARDLASVPRPLCIAPMLVP